MSVKHQAIAILRSKEIDSIQFRIRLQNGGTRTVEPWMFKEVAAAISQDRISLKLAPALQGSFVAFYQPLDDSITLSPGSLEGDPAVFVHEAWHAYLDLTNTNILAIDDEAAGAIIEILYLFAKKMEIKREGVTYLYQRAFDAAEEIRAKLLSKPGGIFRIDDQLWKLVKEALHLTPEYVFPALAEMNDPSLGRVVTGQRSSYNGVRSVYRRRRK